MKTVTFTEFKRIITNPEEVKEGSCLEVTFNCEHLGLFIVGAVEGMRSKLFVLASQIDAMRGMDRKPEPPPIVLASPIFDVSDFIKHYEL